MLTIATRYVDEHVEDDHGLNPRRELNEDDGNRGGANSGSDEAG